MPGKIAGLVKMVREDHKSQNALVGTGHDFTHALMVGQYALQITSEHLCTLGWVAALFHNTDRLYPEKSEEKIAEKVCGYLTTTQINDINQKLIVEAVLKHSKKPSADDSPLTIVLMDADKLSNMGLAAIIRAGQFRPNVATIDLRYLDKKPPRYTFKNPGSVYWDIYGHIEWYEQKYFRIPKARELAESLYQEERAFFDQVARPYNQVGLIPYPFPEDFD